MRVQPRIYLCHDCGTRLVPASDKLWWCDRCKKKRRTPTDPFLILAP